MINCWVNKISIPICLGTLLLFMSSCSEQRRTKVKDYPLNTAFVFNNSIKIIASDLKGDQKKRLLLDLDNYWDDSLKVKKLQRFVFLYAIKNPPKYDTVNISRSINYMNSYLQSLGYFYTKFNQPVVKVDTFHQKSLFHKFDKVKDQNKIQYRTYISFAITPGPKVLIGKVNFKFADSVMQKLATKYAHRTLLVKGEPYMTQTISSELDRILNIFRRNGYYAFTKENLYAYVDSFSSFSNKQKPEWDVTILNRANLPATVLKQYITGKMYYYPDAEDIYDTTWLQKHLPKKEGKNFSVYYDKYLFKSAPLINNTFLKTDSLYNEPDYFKTINAFNQIGAWKQIEIKPVIRNKDTIDFHIFLTPSKKQSITLDLEGSKNTGDIAAGNLFGISGDISLRNKNVWKKAIQSYTTLNSGVELSAIDTSRLLQTFQFSISQTYVISKKKKPLSEEITQNLLSLNATYTDRFQIYRLRSVVASWGEQKKRNNNVFLLRPINIEMYSLEKFSGLDSLISKNPFLKLSFNTGNVVSQSISFIKTFPGHKTGLSHYIRLGVEVSGLIDLLYTPLKETVYQYGKGEAEYRFVNRYRKAELAGRMFAGVGYNWNNSNDIGKVLPFFKQFTVGGPNSMRAWGLRQLGLGTSLAYDTSASSFKDRFGDLRLESNLEYRFTIFNFGTFNIASALFADAGNVWNMRKDPTDPDASLNLNNVGKSIAIAVGTGIRFDFSYFLIRVDAAYKVKDPARIENAGWMDFKSPTLSEKRANGTEVRNFAIQLGIGLPF